MATHECIHENQIIEQSKSIERLDAGMTYKKERLDDLKEDNRRMEKKIDDMSNSLSKFIAESNSEDGKLDNRLTAIETRLDEQDKRIKNNDQKSRDNYMKLGAVVAVMGLIVAFMNFIYPILR